MSLCHWSQSSFPRVFFWGLQTNSSRWWPDLENSVCAEAIRSAIHVVLPLLRSTCDMVHCLSERAHFSSSFVAFFWKFLPSNTPIMLFNIHYWWFSLSQGNRWTKYLAHPKIWRPKPCLLMFVSFVVLDGFHLLLSTQLSANLTPEWSGRSTFHPLSHIYTETPFSCIETVANNALNCRHGVFDRLWTNAAPSLNTAVSLTNVYANIHGEYTAFWYLQLLCYLMQLQFTIDQNEFVEFFGVFWDNCWIWATWAFTIFCVGITVFKVSISPLNCCFQRSRFRITLNYIALLEQYFFPPKSNALSTHEIHFFYCFENLQK